MVLHGAHGDHERAGDPAVGVALGGELGDAALARGQRPRAASERTAWPGARAAQVGRGLRGEAGRATGVRRLVGVVQELAGLVGAAAVGGDRRPEGGQRTGVLQAHGRARQQRDGLAQERLAPRAVVVEQRRGAQGDGDRPRRSERAGQAQLLLGQRDAAIVAEGERELRAPRDQRRVRLAVGREPPAAGPQVGDPGSRLAQRDPQRPAGVQQHRRGVQVAVGLLRAGEARRRQDGLGLGDLAAGQECEQERRRRRGMAERPALAAAAAPGVARRALGHGEVAGAEGHVGPEDRQHGHLQRRVAGAPVGQRGVHERGGLVEVIGRGEAANRDGDRGRPHRIGVRGARQHRGGQAGGLVAARAGHRQLGGGRGELGRRRGRGIGVDARGDGVCEVPGRQVHRRPLAGLVDDVRLELLARPPVPDLIEGPEQAAEVALGISGLGEHRDERDRRLQPLRQRARQLGGGAQMLHRVGGAERDGLGDAQGGQDRCALGRGRRLLERAAQMGDGGLGRTALHRVTTGVAQGRRDPWVAVGLGAREVRGQPLGRRAVSRQQLGGAPVGRGQGAGQRGGGDRRAEHRRREHRVGAAIQQGGEAQGIGGGAPGRAVQAGQGAGQRPGGVVAEHCQRERQRARRIVEGAEPVGDAAPDGVADLPGPAHRVLARSGPRLYRGAGGGVLGQCGDVEREPSARVVAGGGRRGAGPGRRARDEPRRCRRAERGQPRVLGAREGAAHGVAGGAVGGRGDHHQRDIPGPPRQRAEQPERPWIGALEIVDYERARPAGDRVGGGALRW
ncbi:MAG: hypothetical protein QOF86_1708, partial [Baekduia sp.]|nr:hypothetical protein [Baekduia sp.]